MHVFINLIPVPGREVKWRTAIIDLRTGKQIRVSPGYDFLFFAFIEAQAWCKRHGHQANLGFEGSVPKGQMALFPTDEVKHV